MTNVGTEKYAAEEGVLRDKISITVVNKMMIIKRILEFYFE